MKRVKLEGATGVHLSKQIIWDPKTTSYMLVLSQDSKNTQGLRNLGKQTQLQNVHQVFVFCCVVFFFFRAAVKAPHHCEL